MPSAEGDAPLRVLQSFPHKIGSGRISDIAWHQAESASEAGARVTVFPGVVHRALPPSISVSPTLARGRWRLPYRALGLVRTLELHDRIVARRLERIAAEVDVVHAWPLAARHTLAKARMLGITTVLERPNAHTRFAYEVVQRESDRIGVELPRGHEHAFDATRLRIEEQEYDLADYLLCPSDFVARTFLDRGFTEDRIVRHAYGYDQSRFFPPGEPRKTGAGITVLFAGFAAVRKGLHFALDAWLTSPASRQGKFLVAGSIYPGYEEHLRDRLAHESVRTLGQRTDVPELMREADALVLPSIEEGMPLVTLEALASGCVPLVSDICTDACVDGFNALVHPVGDVAALAAHFTRLHDDRALLDRLAENSVASARQYTWNRAGEVLLQAYLDALARHGVTYAAGRPG